MRLSTPPGPVPVLPQQEVAALLELVVIGEDEGAAAPAQTVPAPAPAVDETLEHDLDEAEHLVLELDREVRASTSWGRDADGRQDAELVALAREGDDAALAELLGHAPAWAT